MDPDEAAKFLQGDIQFDPSQTGVQTMPTIGRPTPPAVFDKPTAKKSEERFREEHAQPGVPLDVESGVPTWESLMLEARRSRENQIKYLEGKYGEDNIRMTRDGEMFVKVQDPEAPGKKKELLVFPHGKMTASDLLNLSVAMPEVAGWVAGEKLASKIPGMMTPAGTEARGLLPAAARLGAGAVGAETVGAVTKDLPANIYDFQALNLPEVLKGRGQQAAADVGVGTVIGGVGRAIRFARAPLAGSRGQLELDALQARKDLQAKYGGKEVPFSVGESTGVPLFARSEAFVEKEPGGSGPIRKVKGQQEEALRELQRKMMGTSIPLDEEVGTKAIQEIQSKIEPAVSAEQTARGELGKQAQGSLEGIISGVTQPSRELYKSVLGDDIRQSVIGKRDAAKAEADRLYAEVRSAEGGTGKAFNGKPLQQRFEDILSKLPSMEETVTKPTGLLDAKGQPITSTSTRQTLLEKWPPDKLLARLREITSAKDPRFALSDLQQMRRDIYDDITKSEGKPELGVHYLSQIGDAITSFMKESIDNLPSGDLKTALQAADKHYRENVVPFNRTGLTELFRAANEPGYVPDNQIVNRVLGGENAYKNWQLMKETLGETSKPFTRLKRAVADNILEASRLPGDETIDAKSFAQNLYNFRRLNREISDDVFSPNELELFRQARFLQYAQGDKFDTAELQKLLAGGDVTAVKLQSLLDAERQKDTLYKNQIIKAIGDGKIDETTLRPTDFVNRLLSNSSFGVADTKQVMDLLASNPALRQEMRQKTFEKIFRDAARPAKAEDITRTASGDNTHILSGVSLNQALKDKAYRSKIEAVLGPDYFTDLQNYIKLTAPLEKKEEAYALAGGLAAGSRIGQLERVLEGRGGLMRFAGNTMRSFVFSWMLSNPAMRSWLSRTASDPPGARNAVVMALTSPPFIEAVAKQFPGVTGARFINNLRQSIQQSVGGEQQQADSQLPRSAAQPMTPEQRREFLNQP